MFDTVVRQLKDYQVDGINFMFNLLVDPKYRGVMLCDEMGLGKTSMFFISLHLY